MINFGPGQSIVDLGGVLRYESPHSLGAAAPATLVLDNYTDVDGTLLPAHTPDIAPVGSSWTMVAGTATIQSNACRINGRAQIDAGTTIATVTANYPIALTTASLFYLRYVNSSNFWAVGQDGNPGRLYIYEYTSGFTVRASALHGLSNGTYSMVASVTAGNVITCTINNATSVSYTSSQHAAGTRFGLYTTGEKNIDSFTVTSP